jgi:oligopeptide/dipeptide ABC transporter ATP-binding protein
MSSLLSVKNLQVEFRTDDGPVKAVRGVSLSVSAGETLAIVGESGCGKSVTFQALLGLLPSPPAQVRWDERSGQPKDWAMIFQDPMTSLNPTLTLGTQLEETLRARQGLRGQAAREAALSLLEQVRIPEACTRLGQYPFELSGGMRQRVMIAIALACKPRVLIADEPTTALDVTIQAQILALLKQLQKEQGMALVLITHDLGVVARMADRVAVFYAGQVVEEAPVQELFDQPRHPYTQGLRASLPGGHGTAAPPSISPRRLTSIDGSPPDLLHPPKGCAFFERCCEAMQVCRGNAPDPYPVSASHFSRCWREVRP